MWCFVPSARHTESKVAPARSGSQAKFSWRQRDTSPPAAAQRLSSSRCLAASIRHKESRCTVAMLSSSCCRAWPATAAADCFQRYCATRQRAIPGASKLMALQFRISARFLASVLQLASTRLESARATMILGMDRSRLRAGRRAPVKIGARR